MPRRYLKEEVFMRSLTNSEIATLVAASNSAESWASVLVADDFDALAKDTCFGYSIVND